MSLSETIVIAGAFIVGYVVVWSFLLRSKDESYADPDFGNNSNKSEQQNSYQEDENFSFNEKNTNSKYDVYGISTIDDCFAILELNNSASSDDIKLAYKRKMKEYHPDKVAHLGEKLKSIAELETKKLNLAYSMLRDAGYVNNA